jgi:uncharacterized protein
MATEVSALKKDTLQAQGCSTEHLRNERTMAIPNTPALNCDDCGACCLNVGNPPFLLDMKDGTLRNIGGIDSAEDFHRLLEAPVDARIAFAKNSESTTGPCSWLDQATRRCQFYNFRPEICRTFEIGGKWCSELREIHQIE